MRRRRAEAWVIPAAVLAHERQRAVPVPAACPHCGAAATAFRDDQAGHVRCLLCGWDLLYRRAACDAVATDAGHRGPPRGRGRAAA